MISPFKALLALSFAAALAGCKPANQTSDLKVTVGPTPATALPVAMNSCKNTGAGTEDLQSPSFSFSTFVFQWNGSNDMKIAYIQIEFLSGLLQGGKYQCIIAGDELARVITPKEGGISGGDATSYKSVCGLRCGGLNVVSTVSSAFITGTAKIVGTEVDSEGNATPVVTDVDVSVQYTKP